MSNIPKSFTEEDVANVAKSSAFPLIASKILTIVEKAKEPKKMVKMIADSKHAMEIATKLAVFEELVDPMLDIYAATVFINQYGEEVQTAMQQVREREECVVWSWLITDLVWFAYREAATDILETLEVD